jgi:PIN domain nuclease of toxin-antitoxin system
MPGMQHVIPVIWQAAALPNLPPVHKDPFDRLLAAQVLVEELTLVTREPIVNWYAIPVVVA